MNLRIFLKKYSFYSIFQLFKPIQSHFQGSQQLDKFDNLSALRSGLDESISTLETLIFPEPSVFLMLFIFTTLAFPLILNYPKNDQQKIHKMVPDIHIPNATLFLEKPQKSCLKARFLDLYSDKTHIKHYSIY